jgi:hypothetical protein
MATDLHWNSEAVAVLMAANQIFDRADLVRALPRIGQTTVYRAFDKGWRGRATTKVLAALSEHFSMPLAELVERTIIDPRSS